MTEKLLAEFKKTYSNLEAENKIMKMKLNNSLQTMINVEKQFDYLKKKSEVCNQKLISTYIQVFFF